jgi:membrane-bound serine protease (ClpP class)
MNRGYLHFPIAVILCVIAATIARADTNPPRLIPPTTNIELSSATGAIHSAKATPGGKKLVYVIPVRDDIEKPLVYVVRRGIKDAIANGAGLVVLDMNTNGGRGDAMEEIMELLDEFDGDTITFINKKAYSAGAFISAATKHIYMAPGSVIGAAAPMLMTPQGDVEKTPDTVEKKFVSAYAAKIRAAAQKNGHNAEVFEAMVNKVKGLKIDSKEIIKEGEILTLTNVEAEKEYGTPPKRLLSDGTVADLDALYELVGYAKAEVKKVEPTGAEQVAQWITAIAPILLLLGILGIYIEIKLQTFGVIGVLAILCFIIYFFGHYIAGLSGLEFLALFAVGVILILVEVFAFPGTAVLGVLGSLFIIISLIMAMVDRMPNTPIVPTMPQLEMPLIKFGIAIAGAIVGAIILGKFLPHTALFNAFVLQTASGGTIASPTLDTKRERLLGATGNSLSPLRPAGKAMIGDKLMDVVTEGDHIPAHTPIKVIAVEGARVVVARA